MNNIIQYELTKYLNCNNLYNLSICNKLFRKLLSKEIKERKERIDKINFILPERIIYIIGLEKLFQARHILWKPEAEWLGWGDEIELEMDDITTPLSYGLDCYERPFVIVRYKIGGKIKNFSIYQRYSYFLFISDRTRLTNKTFLSGFDLISETGEERLKMFFDNEKYNNIILY